MSAESLIWALMAAIGLLDVVLFAAQGMTAIFHWSTAFYLIVLWGGAKIIERRIPPAARLTSAFAQLFAFCQVGSCLTYVAMAASPFPLADGLLSRWDSDLGFDWPAWFAWVHTHPAVHFIMVHAYASVTLQVLALLLYFSYVNADRVDELLLATILATAIIAPVNFLLPAIGAWSQHGVGIEPWRGEILALRSHTLLIVDHTQGIITFPSFHTVCGVLLINMARGHRLFMPVLLLNVLLIASVMSVGAHYAVDMLSGLAVACIAIAAARSITAWCKSLPTEKPVSARAGPATDLAFWTASTRS
jgi:hypothetical protein